VSRQTFGRIVEAARRTVADAVINGKRLRIEGGKVVVRTEGASPMKIAAPVRGTEIDSHFGHCEAFSVFTLDGRRAIVAEERLASAEGCGCKSGIGATLAKMGVTHLVAGNMGDGAVRVLASHGIAVTRGASGNARAAVERYATGALADSGTGCAEHPHGHDCGHGD
jgi:predicted Fe-Mo cluster-binding NifX family protein